MLAQDDTRDYDSCVPALAGGTRSHVEVAVHIVARSLRRFASLALVVVLGTMLLAAPAFAAVDRVDATTANTTFTLPLQWSLSSPGIPHFGGSVYHSSITNATATFVFEGTGLDLVYAKWHNRGIAAVSVDGGAEMMVDMYAPGTSDTATVQTQQVATIASGLPDGSHTLRVRVTGTRNPASSGNLVNIDAYDVHTPDPVNTPASSAWSILIGAVLAGGVIVMFRRGRTA